MLLLAFSCELLPVQMLPGSALYGVNNWQRRKRVRAERLQPAVACSHQPRRSHGHQPARHPPQPHSRRGSDHCNAIPFQIRTEPAFPCGGGAQFELVLTSSNLPPTAVLYTFLGGSGYGLDLDGIDDRAQAGTNLFSTLNNNFTVELWANPTGNRVETAEVNSGVSVVFHQIQRFAVYPDRSDLSYGPGHAGAGLSIGRNGISVFKQSSNYFPSLLVYSNPVPTWTHIAVVYSSRRPRLYVNGVLGEPACLAVLPLSIPAPAWAAPFTAGLG